MKRDRLATIAAGFANPKSFIGNRIHPGTNHACRYLRGDDVRPMREYIFYRDGGKCCVCGAYYGLQWGELHHIKGGLGLDRCWCEENLLWICPKDHRNQHVRILSDRRSHGAIQNQSDS